MAFGETGRLAEVKKKPIVVTPNPVQAAGSPADLPTPLNGSGDGDQNNSPEIQPKPLRRTGPRGKQPPGMTTAQWEEWRTRDSEVNKYTFYFYFIQKNLVQVIILMLTLDS